MTLPGSTWSFSVTGSWKVDELKLLVQQSLGIPPCQQRLVFKDVQLNDKHTLAHQVTVVVEGHGEVELTVPLKQDLTGKSLVVLAKAAAGDRHSSRQLKHCCLSH